MMAELFVLGSFNRVEEQLEPELCCFVLQDLGFTFEIFIWNSAH